VLLAARSIQLVREDSTLNAELLMRCLPAVHSLNFFVFTTLCERGVLTIWTTIRTIACLFCAVVLLAMGASALLSRSVKVRHQALDTGFYPVMLFFSAYLVFLAVITRPAVRVWIHVRITLQCEWLFRRSFRRVESLTALSSAEAAILGRPATESASRSAVEPISRPIADGSAARVALHGDCVVCCDQLATHVFTACGHLCACGECAKSIIESTALCPICRTPSSTAVKVYVASMQN